MGVSLGCCCVSRQRLGSAARRSLTIRTAAFLSSPFLLPSRHSGTRLPPASCSRRASNCRGPKKLWTVPNQRRNRKSGRDKEAADIARGEGGGAMLGAFRWDGRSCLRWSGSLGGTGCYRAGFETLSHGSRSFHHKIRPSAPQSPTVLENFPAAATTTFPAVNPAPLYTTLVNPRRQIASTLNTGYCLYSHQSSRPSSIMAGVEWTGPRVRKTFLDYFAERGHAIGTGPAIKTILILPMLCPAELTCTQTAAAMDKALPLRRCLSRVLTSWSCSSFILGRPPQ